MRVLVTGIGGPAGRSLVEQLLARGIEVVGTDMNTVDVPDITRYLVPAADNPRFRTALPALIALESIDLVIPTVSEELPVVAELAGPIIISSPESVAVADDKWLTYRALAQSLVPVPRTVLPQHLCPPVEDWLGRPFVVKPRTGRGGRGVSLHVGSVFDVPISTEDVVSEFIPGTEYCPNLYIADDPRDDVAVVLRKTGLKQGRVGNATGVVREIHAGVKRVAINAARAAKLTGPVDVDVRLRANGQPVVLELNARFGANSAHAPEVLDAVLAHHRELTHA